MKCWRSFPEVTGESGTKWPVCARVRSQRMRICRRVPVHFARRMVELLLARGELPAPVRLGRLRQRADDQVDSYACAAWSPSGAATALCAGARSDGKRGKEV